MHRGRSDLVVANKELCKRIRAFSNDQCTLRDSLVGSNTAFSLFDHLMLVFLHGQVQERYVTESAPSSSLVNIMNSAVECSPEEQHINCLQILKQQELTNCLSEILSVEPAN